jgi:predicted outer membrane repeat protein
MHERRPCSGGPRWTARLSAASILIVLALAGSPTPSGAAVLHVPSEHPTIQAGIDAADAGDTVVVACGTYYEHSIRMDEGVVLRSETGEASCVTIDVSGHSNGIWCLSLNQPTRIIGFTITGAVGNALALRSSDVTIENCRFWRNFTPDPAGGGAVLCGYGFCAPSLINCRFDENVSLGEGGGLHSQSSDPTLIDCVFSRNVAVRHGGGARFAHGFPTLIRCTFADDSTSAWGGGLYVAQATATLLDCVFTGCRADSGSGGLHFSSSGVLASGCRFEQNRTFHAGGGGASFHVSVATIERTTFTGNTSYAEGGGADFNLSDVTMTECVFTANDAANGSGGGMNAGNTLGTVDGCSFLGNSSNQAGGGFHSGSSPLSLTNSVFEDNNAPRGGGLSYGDSPGLVDGCAFRRNHATNNGGGMNTSLVDPIIRNCVFEENTAAGPGGGVSTYRSRPEISSCVFANNTSEGTGGGIFSNVDSRPTILSCTFSGNAAIDGGGGVASTNESSMTLDQCIIAYSPTGLALHCDPTSSVTFSCSDLYGNIGGDWVGCAAGQDTLAGNFCASPLFCNRVAGDFHLAENSPCANAPGCGLVGALPIGCGLLDVGDPEADLTRRLILGPSAPNPFRESAEIRYVLTASSDPALVRFDVYAADGRLVRRLVNEPRQPGIHAVRWDGQDDAGRRLPSGIYFARLRVGGRGEALRIVRVE